MFQHQRCALNVKSDTFLPWFSFLLIAGYFSLFGCGQSQETTSQTETEPEIQDSDRTKSSTQSKGSKIEIGNEEEREIRRLLREFQAHTDSDRVSLSSGIEPYIDCDAYRSLVKYGFQAIPYLIEQAGKLQEIDVLHGSALIQQKGITTPENVWDYHENRRKSVYKSTIPHFVLVETLNKIAPDENFKVGARHTDCFSWLVWWKSNKNRFAFTEKSQPSIPEPEDVYYEPHISTSVHNNLLDIHAVSATNRHIIQRAGAELGVKIHIGQHKYMDVLTTIRMKGVNVEEFLYFLGKNFSIKGINYTKTENEIRIGTRTPAPARVYFGGWGIAMDQTVFLEGDEIPIMITEEYDPEKTSPTDWQALKTGQFKITNNEGKLLKTCSPVKSAQPPTETDRGPCQGSCKTLALEKSCNLGPGEYNVAWKYRKTLTPTIAFEIYNRP